MIEKSSEDALEVCHLVWKGHKHHGGRIIFLFCSVFYLKFLQIRLAHNKCLINSYWMNGLILKSIRILMTKSKEKEFPFWRRLQSHDYYLSFTLDFSITFRIKYCPLSSSPELYPHIPFQAIRVCRGLVRNWTAYIYLSEQEIKNTKYFNLVRIIHVPVIM